MTSLQELKVAMNETQNTSAVGLISALNLTTTNPFLDTGGYLVKCTNISEKKSQYNGGSYIVANFVVSEGEEEGSFLSHNFNIEHDNKIFENRERLMFQDFMKTAEKPVERLEDLIGTECKVMVSLVEANGNYPKCNRINLFIEETDETEPL